MRSTQPSSVNLLLIRERKVRVSKARLQAGALDPHPRCNEIPSIQIADRLDKIHPRTGDELGRYGTNEWRGTQVEVYEPTEEGRVKLSGFEVT